MVNHDLGSIAARKDEPSTYVFGVQTETLQLPRPNAPVFLVLGFSERK
jgi:hypothetical protein